MKVTERGGAQADKFVVILSFHSRERGRTQPFLYVHAATFPPDCLMNYRVTSSPSVVSTLPFHTGYTETLLYIRDDLKDYGLPVKPEQFAETSLRGE